MSDQMYKADAGKSDPSLLEEGFPIALAFIQSTLDYGAIKYEAHSWRKVPDAFRRYNKAARRHRVARDRDRDFMSLDDESGLPHVAHELFNLMAQIELFFQNNPDYDYERFLQFNEPPQDHKK